MRLRLPQGRVMNAVMPFALVSCLCGASPQEGRVPRPQPQGTPQPTPAPQPAPQPQSAPQTQDNRGASYQKPNKRSGAEGRVAKPAPPQRRVTFYPGSKIVVPPHLARCTVLPTTLYWRQRDLMAEIKFLARRGFIPVTPLGDGVELLSDYAQTPAGWRAYGLSVPAGGTVQVEVQHDKIGWFRLMLVNKWGEPGPGMLQAAAAHRPVMITYKNPGTEATAIYVIVDDPAWWSDANWPYTLVVRRDWDPAQVDLSQVKMVAGLWGATPSVSAQFRGPSLSGPAVHPR